METKTHIDLLTFEEQLQKLRDYLHPNRSRIRPFLALFAIKNHLLNEVGLEVNNDPTISWYQKKLIKAGITASYRNIYKQLESMAKLGILDKKRRRRPVLPQNTAKVARYEVSEYELNEAIYPALERALKQLLGVNSFYSISGLEDP